MADATTLPQSPTVPSTGMNVDVSKLFQQEAAQKKQTEATLQRQMEVEQQEHVTHEAEIGSMARELQGDITQNEKLAGMDPEALAKYLNLSAITQPPKQQSLTMGTAVKKLIPMVLAFAIIGRKAGGNQFGLQDSLTAVAGVLNGWKQGNDQKYQESYQQWKDSTDQLVKDNQTRLQAYKDTLANKNLNLDQRLQLLQILSTQDPYTHALVKGGDLCKLEGHFNALDGAYKKFIDQYTKTDHTIKPIKVQTDVASATRSVIYADPGIPKPDPQDASKTPWWNLLANKEASFAQFLLNQATANGQQMTPYEAALQAHQEAIKNGWIKKDSSGNVTDVDASGK